MGNNNSISHKIDAYAQANLQSLKKEEAKTGRKMTKFDIAQYMLQHGKLNKNEYANWMNTREGFDAQAMTQQQKTALRQGNVWGFAGYGGGEESYLDSLTSFSQKTPVEKQKAISGYYIKLNETVAERKKKAEEINNHLKNERVLNLEKTKAEQEFKAQVDSAKISEEDKNKDAIELTKEIEEISKNNEQDDHIFRPDMKNHPIRTILTSPLRGAGYLAGGVILGPMIDAMECRKDIPESETSSAEYQAEIMAEQNQQINAFNKVLTQLLEKSPMQEKRLKNRKTLENIINNFPKNKAELKKHINEYSKYVNMDKVKSMLYDNVSYNDIKECALQNLKNALENDYRYKTFRSDETYFELKDVDAIKDNDKLTIMLYCYLFKSGYTAEQIHDMLPTMGHSAEQIKNAIDHNRSLCTDDFLLE